MPCKNGSMCWPILVPVSDESFICFVAYWPNEGPTTEVIHSTTSLEGRIEFTRPTFQLVPIRLVLALQLVLALLL